MNIPTEGESISDMDKFPEIIVFAGPNGSGKTTITRLAKVIEPYINADDIKRTTHCTDMVYKDKTLITSLDKSLITL